MALGFMVIFGFGNGDVGKIKKKREWRRKKGD